MHFDNECSRREFLKTTGAAGLGLLATAAVPESLCAQDPGRVPTRPFGKTGSDVAILSMGGMFDIPNNQLMMRQAVKWGVTYWDTANSYEGGNSELGIGKYFAKYPEDRKSIFLVTKSTAWTLKGMTEHLNLSLERMRTDFVDLFFVHAIRSISTMDKEMQKWGEKAKSEGRIRFFGFSTHSNMEECLLGAAPLGWIDGIMMTYNYRLMHTDAMRRAVDACAKAGIGLTAMKTQGGGQVLTGSEEDIKRGGRFLQSGFTPGQVLVTCLNFCHQSFPAQGHEPGFQLPFFLLELAVSLRCAGLALQTAQVFTHLVAQIGQPRQVVAGVLDSSLGFAAPFLVLGNARRLFQMCPNFLRPGIDDFRNHALLDNGIAA